MDSSVIGRRPERYTLALFRYAFVCRKDGAFPDRPLRNASEIRNWFEMRIRCVEREIDKVRLRLNTLTSSGDRTEKGDEVCKLFDRLGELKNELDRWKTLLKGFNKVSTDGEFESFTVVRGEGGTGAGGGSDSSPGIGSGNTSGEGGTGRDGAES